MVGALNAGFRHDASSFGMRMFATSLDASYKQLEDDDPRESFITFDVLL